MLACQFLSDAGKIAAPVGPSRFTPFQGRTENGFGREGQIHDLENFKGMGADSLLEVSVNH